MWCETHWISRALSLLLAAIMAFFPPVLAAGQLAIAQVPLAKSSSASISPNLMFILDNSGSMDWTYLPDYVDDGGTCKTATGTKNCAWGDPPYMSSDFNAIYYNPQFVYAPAVNSDGTSMAAQTNLALNRTDPFRTSSTTNNATGFTETVYCNTTSPSSSDINNATNISSVCRVASDDYDYPNAVYFNAFTRNAAPYYFRANITGYCTDAKLTSCIQTTAPTGAYTWPAKVRFCKTGSATDCQERYSSATGYTKPNYLNPMGAGAAYATLDITSVSHGLSFSSIKVDGVDVLGGATVTAGASDTLATIATAVMNAINGATSNPEYRACVGTRTGDNACSGSPTSRVTIFPQTATGGSTALQGVAANGRVLATTAPSASKTRATGTITISGVSRAPSRVTAVTVGGVSVLSGAVTATDGLDTSTKRNTFATALAAAITGGGYAATASADVVTILAPTGSGIEQNGKAIVVTGSLSSTATITINDNGAGNASATICSTACTNGAGSPTTMSSGSAVSAGGVNSSAERDSLAVTLAGRLTANSYTTSSSTNVVSVYSPVGTVLTTTPTIPFTPSVAGAVSAVAASASFTFTQQSSASVSNMTVVAGGACSVPGAILNNPLMTGSTVAAPSADNSTNRNLVASRTVANNISGDMWSLQTGASNQVIVRDASAGNYGAALNGCILRLTLASGSLNGSSTTLNQAFAGGVSASPAVTALVTRTAFSGGYATSTSPNFVSVAAMSGGSTTGAITANAGIFSNGQDAIKTFSRCDITSTSTNCAGPAMGQFPRDSKRTDCACVSSASTPSSCEAGTPAPGYCTYAEESTNFGNWFSYYRRRMLSMKSAAGLAFSGLGGNFRIGFVTIGNYNSGDGAGSFLPVDAFTGTQKTTWYSKLYAQGTPHATPLRHALSSVGRYFAGKNPYTMTSVDPMQFACQQNFALLTTDGYWNEPWDSGIKKVDGAVIDNADGAAGVERPYYDGGLGGACGVGNNVSGASSCGTLADVAYHYYNTDLRSPSLATSPPNSDCKGASVGTSAARYDVCENIVKGAGEDNVGWQHMTTYTLGLGVDGVLDFNDGYKNETSGDFADIKSGAKNWPQAKNSDPSAVDDLWHAAVNGRGQYFSARNPALLTKNLRDALAGIQAQVGSGAASATSNLEPTPGDNFSYVASYTSSDWIGNLEAREIDVVTGQTKEQALWCIEDVAARPDKGTTACTGAMKSQVGDFTDTRSIYLFDSSSSNKLRSFSYANMNGTERSYFNPTSLAQYPLLPLSTKAKATGATLVDYLRGQWGYEDQDGNVDRIYRDRKATMSDAVSSQPVYVRKPPFTYTDPGYAGFKSAKASRDGVVYLGTNDGMLHAFNSVTGAERWAYVPSPMLPNMQQLADANYRDNHRYFVDGSPVVTDVCFANCTDGTAADWRTVLVGGYAGGGKGYFALDVTDPANPKGLWELGSSFDADIGYSYGNPIMTKRDDGKWVVLLTSGHNNVGTGRGYLFVVDVGTGAILKKISTGVGDSGTPSGLSRIEAYVADSSNNTVKHVYGGDLLGNVWRFMIDKDNEEAVKVAVLEDSIGNPQPITTRPLVTELDDVAKTRYVIVATGKYIELSDTTNTQKQSFYAFVEKYDTNGNQTVGICSGCTNGARDQLTEQTFINGPDDARGRKTRVAGGVGSEPPADRKVQGCFVDFPVAGERMNVDMKLTRGVASVITNVAASDVCTAGGYSFINFLDYKTCKVVDSYVVGQSIAVGMVVLKLASGGFVVTATLADNPTPELVGTVPPSPSVAQTGFTGRRVGWRLLYD